MRGLLVTVVAAFTLMGNVAQADLESASRLKDMCFGSGKFAGKLKEVAEGVCWGYITGVADVVVAGTSVAGITACAPQGPEGISRGRIIEIAKSYLDRNRERLRLPAYALIAEALRDAFPCE